MGKPKTPNSPLRNIRRARTMTQEDLGRLVGITPEAISQAERGIHGLRFDVKQRIAAVLGATVPELFPVPEPEQPQSEGQA